MEHRRTLLVGVDHVWCDADADKERVTFRGFPEWMYDADWRNDLPYMLNAKALEISGRRFAQSLGLKEARFIDGYEVFTPPESAYDPIKVRLKLANGPAPQQSQASPFTASAAERAGWDYPALVWLDEIAKRFGGSIVFVYVPAHIAAQPKPGSVKAARREECKARIAAIARRHEAPFIDFDLNSEITALDANWWDRLHYRVPIADRIVKDIEQALIIGKDDPKGHWRYREGPRPGTTSLTSQ